MSLDITPVVGNWYEQLDKGIRFQVIDLDEEAGIVEIQYFDGDLDAIELEEWYEVEIEPIEEPEDWTGPLDGVEADDLGYTETDMAPDEWSRSTQEVMRRRGMRVENREGPNQIEDDQDDESDESDEQ